MSRFRLPFNTGAKGSIVGVLILARVLQIGQSMSFSLTLFIPLAMKDHIASTRRA